MECPICFEIIQNSCVGSCMHHYCYNCLLKWIHRGGTKCPICKKFIYEIKLDKEFDSINNKENNNELTREYTKKTIINFDDSLPPGITITSNKGIGVKICKLNSKDKFYKEGYRVNDILLFLNNVPCTEHYESIKIIKHAYENKKDLIVESLIIKK